jgi:hypothetical protein
MPTMPELIKRNGFCGTAVVWLAAVAFLAVAAGPGRAENTQAPPAAAGAVPTPSPPAAPIAPTAAAPRPPQPSAPEKPGFLHELGHWWDGSIGYLHDKIKAAPGTFEDIGKKSSEAAQGAAVATQEGMKKTLDVSKDAAVVIGRLPNTRVVDVHERCAIAGNGAPDCAAAATIACRAKGFSGGKPLDSRTGEACPDTKLASGKTPAPGRGECPLETVVLRAVCQ